MVFAPTVLRLYLILIVDVLTRLAQQFCVCDNWFSSLPGPTFPNRAFMHAATSVGRVDMGNWRNLSPTIYERLAENHHDSVNYYHNSTMASTLMASPGILISLDRSTTILFRRVRTTICLLTTVILAEAESRDTVGSACESRPRPNVRLLQPFAI
jgi:Phosphoesterase family